MQQTEATRYHVVEPVLPGCSVPRSVPQISLWLSLLICCLLSVLTGWTKFLEDKYSNLKAAERETLVERMSIIQENPWVKDEL